MSCIHVHKNSVTLYSETHSPYLFNEIAALFFNDNCTCHICWDFAFIAMKYAAQITEVLFVAVLYASLSLIQEPQANRSLPE